MHWHKNRNHKTFLISPETKIFYSAKLLCHTTVEMCINVWSNFWKCLPKYIKNYKGSENMEGKCRKIHRRYIGFSLYVCTCVSMHIILYTCTIPKFKNQTTLKGYIECLTWIIEKDIFCLFFNSQ
jgi:hypothetical protein